VKDFTGGFVVVPLDEPTLQKAEGGALGFDTRFDVSQRVEEI
jgi:hypothetical protein